jgi:hypothetical protein
VVDAFSLELRGSRPDFSLTASRVGSIPVTVEGQENFRNGSDSEEACQRVSAAGTEPAGCRRLFLRDRATGVAEEPRLIVKGPTSEVAPAERKSS